MLASLESASVIGIHASPVHIEVDLCFGLPRFQLVGLPDTSVKESRDRVHAAIRNSGFDFPQHRIVINMAPADVRKAGSSFDLPIALGILAASGVVLTRDIRDVVIVGELSLDGTIHPARGVLPIAVAAREQGAAAMLLPAGNTAEASVVEGLRLLPAGTLSDAVGLLNQHRDDWPLSPPPPGVRRGRQRQPDGPVRLTRPGVCQTCAGSGCGGGPQPADDRPARVRARPCSRAACPPSCRRSPSTKRWRPPPSIRWRV